MSRDALKWAGVQAVGRSTAKLVLLGLAKCANNDGLAWPGVDYLADFSGVLARTVRKELRHLRAGGWIEDSGERRGKTRQIKVWRLRINEPVLPFFGKAREKFNGVDLFQKAVPLDRLSKPSKAVLAVHLSKGAKAVLADPKGCPTGHPEYNDSSVSKETANGVRDPLKELFDNGVSLLIESGVAERRARSLIGAWRKGGRDGEVAVAIGEARAKGITDPVEWLSARLKTARFISPSGYQYRGSPEQIEREAERRADWGTYWAVKGKG
jgi:hypothetical protein